MRFRPVSELRSIEASTKNDAGTRRQLSCPPSAALTIAALLLALAFPAVASPQDNNSDKNYSHARIVRLSYVQGDVQISRPEEDGWEKALANMPIQQGYALSTGQGRAEIEFESGATVRMDENTQIQFNELALLDGNRLTRITVSQGTAIFYANLARNDNFMVLTPGVEVSVPRNSRFRMDVTEKHVNVAVLKGDVAVETRGGSYKLTKGQALLFDTRGAENAIVARAAEPDEFERWAADREDGINTARSNSLHYVSPPFRYGIGDLSSHGTWIYAAGYGYVWQPWGISVGWSPYYYGRWMYVGGYGWTWVSYEPWGWLPYHYGSWTYYRTSWVWVPGALHHHRWHPGLVVWVNLGGGRHGWCPRNPFDRPGRIYHNTVINNAVIVNTSTGIIGGGRHDRITGGRNLRDWDEGPRTRDHFGDLRQTRAGTSGGRVNRTGSDAQLNAERGLRPAGRSEERLLKGNGQAGGRTEPSADATAEGGATRGQAGRRFDNDSTDRRRDDSRLDPNESQRRLDPDRRTESWGVVGGRIQRTDRDPDNNNAQGRSRRIGDPNTSVEYDPQRRRYENQPSPRPTVEVERDREDSGSGRRTGAPSTIGGRRDSDAYPTSSGNDPGARSRGSVGGARPSYDEPRGRMPESRPESRPEPRPQPQRHDSGGSMGGRSSDSPRPSPHMESSRPSSPPSHSGGGGSMGGGAGGGGGSMGGGGGRPSGPPPAPPASGGGGRPGKPN